MGEYAEMEIDAAIGTWGCDDDYHPRTRSVTCRECGKRGLLWYRQHSYGPASLVEQPNLNLHLCKGRVLDDDALLAHQDEAFAALALTTEAR